MKWYIKSFIERARNKRVTSRDKWILMRTACLGNDVYKLLGSKLPSYHIQKVRVDLFLKFLIDEESEKSPLSALKYFRKDLRYLFFQQSVINLNFKRSPSILMMDSFSELVDQKFTRKDRSESYFLACYSDVFETYKQEYSCDGLIREKDLFNSYSIFFKEFRLRFPKCTIVFVNFPKKLECREVFINRHNLIKSSIHKISVEYEEFYVLDVPEEIVDWHPNDKFPYHYNTDVYTFLKTEMERLNIL